MYLNTSVALRSKNNMGTPCFDDRKLLHETPVANNELIPATPLSIFQKHELMSFKKQRLGVVQSKNGKGSGNPP